MRIYALCLALLSAGCSSEQQLCAEKLAKLDAMRQETAANLIRQKAECQAVAVEFHGDRSVVDPCMETLRAFNAMAIKTVSDIDKRMTEPDMVRCTELARR